MIACCRNSINSVVILLQPISNVLDFDSVQSVICLFLSTCLALYLCYEGLY